MGKLNLPILTKDKAFKIGKILYYKGQNDVAKNVYDFTGIKKP